MFSLFGYQISCLTPCITDNQQKDKPMYPPGYTTGDDDMAPDNRGSCTFDGDDDWDPNVYKDHEPSPSWPPNSGALPTSVRAELERAAIRENRRHSRAYADRLLEKASSYENPPRRAQIVLPGTVQVGDLQVGETFVFSNAHNVENVYMVISSENLDASLVHYILLRTGAAYDALPTKRVKQVDITIRFVPK